MLNKINMAQQKVSFGNDRAEGWYEKTENKMDGENATMRDVRTVANDVKKELGEEMVQMKRALQSDTFQPSKSYSKGSHQENTWRPEDEC